MKHGLPPDDWDNQLQKLGGGILQSQSWMLFQQQLEREVVWDMGDGWRWAGAVRGSHGLRYLLCGYGPVARDEAAMSTAIMSTLAAAKELGTDFVRIEPHANISTKEMLKLGGRPVAEVDPQHTRVLDLTQPESKLRFDLASGHRNLINGTKRRGISVRLTIKQSDFEVFQAMLAETAKHSNVTFYPASYYQKLWSVLQPLGIAKLYVAEVAGRPVAAALFYDWEGTRYYMHAGAHQQQNRQAKASVSLVWQAILDAKTAGLKRFDLWGVAPADEVGHRLASLSRFKVAFGGKPVDYLGTWDIPVKPLKYRAYSLYRKFRGRG